MPVMGVQNEGISNQDAEQESKSKGSRLAQVIELSEERTKERIKQKKLLQAKQLESYQKDKKLNPGEVLLGSKLDKVV